MPDRSETCRSAVERSQWWRVWLPAGGAVALAAALFWSVCRQREVSFFSDDSPARWIVYPMVPDLVVRPDGPWRTEFRRRFSIGSMPRGAHLTVKAFKEFNVSLNGVEVSHSSPDQSWHDRQIAEVAADLLRVGDNELVVTVTCQRGSPALWLALDLGSEIVVSDEQWQASLLGAEVQPARLAASAPEFHSGTAPADAERPLVSLARVWPVLLSFALLATAIAVLHHRRPPSTQTWLAAKGDWYLCGAAALAWLALLVWNWPSLWYFLGFDRYWHRQYIEYILQHGSLPTGTEGPEMWQPPLYYVVSASLTSLSQLPVDSPAAVALGRAVSYLLSVTQLLFLSACLRRLLPNGFAPRAAALWFAGCLPVQLYLMHYNSNDLLAATLATASLYIAVTVVQSPRATYRRAVGLGVLLGASVITKLTAWPIVLVTLLVLVWQLAAERRPARDWLARAAVPIVTAGAVCGWYFVRNFRNFGNPLPPDQAGFAYGQDLGYAMPVQFVRFGQALVQPFYSAFSGIPDGLYSTLWGDGDWGGDVRMEMRPPWNYDLMAATYLLAVIPSLVMLVGFGSAVLAVLRRWQPEKLLVVGTAAASLYGIAYFYLHHPTYGAIKAHYALPAVTALGFFMAEGYRILAGESFSRQVVLAMALGTWGLASFASYVVLPTSPETSARSARQFLLEEKVDFALAATQRGLDHHPDNLHLRLMEARVLEFARPDGEARAALTAVVEDNPTNAEAQQRLAEVLIGSGFDDRAAPLLERAIGLAPDNVDGYREFALMYLRHNHPQDAQRVARAGLRTVPSDSPLHFAYAGACLQLGETEQAIEHYETAVAFNPQYVPALSALARVYALHPEERYRSASKAVELAERASRLTGQSDPSIEDILAAAYAEAGDFAKAEQTLRAAIERMPPAAPAALRQQLDEHRRHAQVGQPWHD